MLNIILGSVLTIYIIIGCVIGHQTLFISRIGAAMSSKKLVFKHYIKIFLVCLVWPLTLLFLFVEDLFE